MNVKLKTLSILCAASASILSFASCGYHAGGYKPTALANMETFSVSMMANYSLEPKAAVLISSAVADTLQRDGTYRLTSRGKSDFRIEGEISNISYSSLRTNKDDTYISDEISMNVTVNYRVIGNAGNRTLLQNSIIVSSPYYNTGNVQTARTNALSYAAQQIGQKITDTLTNG